MYIDPVCHTGRPSDQRIPQEEAVYDKLEELGIDFARVDHDHADTMEDCLKIESILGAKICKNLFLCNRQQTEFYLLLPALLCRREPHAGLPGHHSRLCLRPGAPL